MQGYIFRYEALFLYHYIKFAASYCLRKSGWQYPGSSRKEESVIPFPGCYLLGISVNKIPPQGYRHHLGPTLTRECVATATQICDEKISAATRQT